MKKFVMFFGMLLIMSSAVNSYAQVLKKPVNQKVETFAVATPKAIHAPTATVKVDLGKVTPEAGNYLFVPVSSQNQKLTKQDLQAALQKLKYSLENLDTFDDSKIQMVNGQTFIQLGNTRLVLGVAPAYATNYR